MSKMRVVFSFDKSKMKKIEVNKEDIYYTLKKNFANIGLKCISQNEILAFESDGVRDDYGKIWAILVSLLECNWFTESVSRCEFIENGESEDIFAQLPKLKKMIENA